MAVAEQTELLSGCESRGMAAIVGMGAISPLGNSVDEGWDNLINGRNGIRVRTYPQYPQINISIAGTVENFNPTTSLVERNIISKADLRYLSLPLQYGPDATFEAMQDANIIVPHAEQRGRMMLNSWVLRDDIDPTGVCVIGATGVGGSIETGIEVHDKLGVGRKADVPDIFRGLPARVATVISMAFGARGGVFMVGAECASANYAQGVALDRIRSGRSKVVVVVGAEAASIPEAINMFEVNGTLSNQTDPNKAPRAFEDPESATFGEYSGFAMGEGAGVMILTDPDYARAKGLRIRGYLAGYGDSSDAYHPSFPHPEGRDAMRAVQIAIKDAGGLPREGLIYENAHATGTPADDIEAKVIRAVMEAYMNRQAGLSSTKPSHGHLLGAASIIEGIWCIKALETGILPPNIKSENPQEIAMLLKLVRNEAVQVGELVVAINNGFGFGGTNGTTVYLSADV